MGQFNISMGDLGIFRQVLRRDRLLVGQWMVFGHHQNIFKLPDGLIGQMIVFQHGQIMSLVQHLVSNDTKIIPPVRYIADRSQGIGLVDGDLHSLLQLQFREEGCKAIHDITASWNRDFILQLIGTNALTDTLYRTHLFHNLPGMIQEFGSRFGGSHTLCRAFENGKPQLLLQLANGLA